jgi:hypothetical protein
MDHYGACVPTGDPLYCSCGCSGDDVWCLANYCREHDWSDCPFAHKEDA